MFIIKYLQDKINKIFNFIYNIDDDYPPVYKVTCSCGPIGEFTGIHSRFCRLKDGLKY